MTNDGDNLMTLMSVRCNHMRRRDLTHIELTTFITFLSRSFLKNKEMERVQFWRMDFYQANTDFNQIV